MHRLMSANGRPRPPVLAATVVVVVLVLVLVAHCAYSATELVNKATRKPAPPVTLTEHMAAHENPAGRVPGVLGHDYQGQHAPSLERWRSSASVGRS